MKNLKKVLSLVLALAMALSLMTVAFAKGASDFADYDKVTNNEAVDVMVALGVFNGTEGNKFDPTAELTREQAAKIVTYMLLGQENADKLTATAAPYADVAKDRWSAGAIAYCTTEGILAGSNGKFDPTGKLTGLAFAKMLLCALGYDAQIENLVGSNWAINTAKLAVNAGLTEDLDGSLNAVMTREQAALMAFNALTAVMVDYEGGTDIKTPDGTSIKVDAKRYNVGHANDSGYKLPDDANDQYMQFCEQYFAKLKLNGNSHNDLNRPANEWIYKNNSVGKYAKTATVTYTANKNNDDGKKAVKSDLKNYYFGGTAADSKVKSTGNVATVEIDSTDGVAALTGNGRVVEIFVTDNIITDIVANDSTLAEIKKVTKDEVTFKTADVKAVEDDDDLYGFFSKLEKGDKVVVVKDGSNNVIEAYEPTKVTGKFTKIKDDDFTVGGEKYQAVKNAQGISKLKADSLDSTFTLTLDKYGYIIAVGDEDVAEDTYAFVLDASANVNKGNYDYAVKLLFTDGTTKWVDVSEVNDKVVADGKVESTTLTGLKNKYVTYTEKDGKYDVTSQTTANDKSGTITKGKSTIFTDVQASNKTVFIVKKNSNYTVYTGIKNVPSMTVAAKNAFVYMDGSVAKIVYITDSATTSNEDQVFIYSKKNQGIEKDDSTVVNYYKAIVNGEDTTIGVKDGEAVEVGLYVNNSYTNEYISKLGDNYVADTADTTSIKVFNQATDKLSDITLKNGILKVSATKGDSYVTADEFNTYIVKGTSAKTDTLALDSDKTFGATGSSEGYALASGDYAVIILDDDGYATDLYLFGASL